MKLNKFILLLLAIGAYYSAHSQFIYTKQGNTSNDFFDVFEDPNTSNLLISCVNATVTPSINFEENHSSILKISPNGLIIDSFNIGQNFLINGKMLYHNNNYYLYGVGLSSTNMNNRYVYPTLIKYDANFNELKKIKLDSVYNYGLSSIQSTVIINNQLYVTYFYGNNPKAKLFKLSLNLDIKDSLTYAASTVTSMIKQGNNLLIAGGGFPNSSTLGRSQAELIDTSFNVISRFNFDSITTFTTTNCSSMLGIFPQFCNLVEISNNSYYAAGFFPTYKANTCYTDDDQAVYAIVKNNSHVVKGNYYGTSGGVREDGANFTASAVKQGKYIYNTCVSNMTYNNYFGNHYTPTSILTAKIDTSGNLIWQKYFNTPGYFYQPAGVCATADSGIVIVGRRYDTLVPAFITALEGFVLKYDKYGNQVFVNVYEHYKPFADILLYPNPAINEATISINNLDKIANAIITITNQIGQVVYQNAKTLDIGLNTILLDTKTLANGLYNVTITSDNGSVTKKLSVVK